MPKPTHRIVIYRNGLSREPRWNWQIDRVENGELIAFSNQNHSRQIDARKSVRELLKAAAAGTVEVVSESAAARKARRRK